MATANTTFTQEQIENLKGVAQKYWGFDNQNFQSAVNKKYGEGSYDSLKWNLANIAGKWYNATTGQVIDTTKPIVDQLPTGNQAQIDANVNTRAQAVASSLGQTYNIDTQQYEAGPTALEIQRNKEQAAFSAANPVGTKATDVSYTPDSQIADEQAFKPSITPVTTAGGTNTSQTSTTGVKTQEKGAPEIDFNSSVGREAEITSNLQTISTAIPDLLSNRQKYNDKFGYTTADIGKKALLDGFFESGKKQLDNINTIKQWAGSSIDDLSASLLDGSISPSVKNTLMSDPVLSANIKRAEDLLRANNKKVDTTAVGEKQTAEVLATTPTIANALENGEIGTDELNALTSSPEQIALKKKRDIEFEDLNKKTAIWDSIENDVNTKYSGSGISASEKAQIVANARKALLPELNRAERAYNNTTAQLTELKKEALSLLETNLSLYKEQKAAEAKVVADKTNFEQQKEIARYQNQLSQANITTEKIVDPATGKTVLVNSKTGDIVASYNTGLKSEAITPYEQAQLNMQDKKLSFDMAKEGQKKWTKLDDGMYQDQEWNVSTKQEMEQNKIVQNISSIPVGTYTGQECGTWARSKLGMTATPGGNSLDDRKKAFSSQDAQEGGMVLFSGGGYDKQYGHIAIVTGVNADGTINVKESNFHGDKTVTERKNVPTTYVQGYYNNTPLVSGATDVTEWFSQKAIDWGTNILNGSAKLSDITWKSNEQLKTEVSSYLANSYKTQQNTDISALTKWVQLVKDLIESPWRLLATGRTGSIPGWVLEMYDPNVATFNAKLDQLNASNFMEGIKSMKWFGALSDAEGKKVDASMSTLSKKNQDEKVYKQALDDLKEVFSNKLSSIENKTWLKYDENWFAIQQQTQTQPSLQTSDSDPLGILK